MDKIDILHLINNSATTTIQQIKEQIMNDEVSGITHVDAKGNTIAHIILSRAKHLSSVLPLLFDRGLHVDSRNLKNQTPLHLFCLYAVLEFTEECMESFLKHKANAALRDDSSSIPLHYLCKFDHKTSSEAWSLDHLFRITKLLLSLGSTFNTYDKLGKPPLHYVKKPHLLQPYIQSGGADINIKDLDGFGVLHRACEREDKYFARAVLEMKGDINIVTEKEQNSCLHLAVIHKKKRFLRDFLFDTCIQLDLQNNEHFTAEDLAKNRGDKVFCQYLKNQNRVYEKLQINRERAHSGKVFFFDLEGDSMFSEYTSQQEGYSKMKMSLGIGYSGTSSYVTFFGSNPKDIEELGKKFDEAEQIVIFNSEADFTIVEKYFVAPNAGGVSIEVSPSLAAPPPASAAAATAPPPSASASASALPPPPPADTSDLSPSRLRIQNWKSKTLDPFQIIKQVEGTWVSLDILAKANKIDGKVCITETPAQLWRTNNISLLTEYCKQDVTILVELYERGSFLHFPITETKGQGRSNIVGGKVIDLFNQVLVGWEQQGVED